jgi:tRNA pseudouridine55 synthase
VVARVRRALKERAVGHTGTLDPFATGLLVVLVGRATRLARFVEQQSKTYLADARLGVRTATDDVTGEVTGRSDVRPTEEEVARVLATFVGPQKQRPPAFSAKKVEGTRSYQLARRGKAGPLAECDVTVDRLNLIGYAYPDLRFRAAVSPGTYLRALARDIGERLGSGAHLTALRREAIGSLLVAQAVHLEEIGPDTPLLSPLAVLGHLPRCQVSDAEAEAIGHGRTVSMNGPASDSTLAVAPGERLVAVGRLGEETFRPQVVLHPVEG